VLQLVAGGRSTRQVAKILGVSLKTAGAYRTNLMGKLGLHSVAELVRYVVRNRIINP
jgi:DNA-binding CsgD family transcriptional regulator